jgi:carboxymethylenebutenolidase
MPHVEQTRYETLLHDVQAGRDWLAAREGVSAVFSVGFCYGGRLAFLSATRPELELAGAIGFYGVPVGPGRAAMPAPADLARECALPHPGPVRRVDPGIPPMSRSRRSRGAVGRRSRARAGHLSGRASLVLRQQGRPVREASADAWRRVLAFVSRNTPPELLEQRSARSRGRPRSRVGRALLAQLDRQTWSAPRRGGRGRA